MSEQRKIKLPVRQYSIAKVVLELKAANVSEVAKLIGRREQDIMRDLAELEKRGLIRLSRRVLYRIKLSELGRRYLASGLPEEVVLRELTRDVKVPITTLRNIGLSNNEFEAALGILRKFGVIKVREGYAELVSSNVSRVLEYVQEIKKELVKYLSPTIVSEVPDSLKEVKRRGLIEVGEIKELVVEATDLLVSSFNMLTPVEVVTVVTPEVISLGNWDSIEFKPFDLSIEPPKLPVARKHFFTEIINYIRELMISLGFEEVKGPHVELELWNFDVLFVPQYHPSRRPSDVYILGGVAPLDPHIAGLLNSVGKYHEEFRKYKWDQERALRLVLRTHCTAVSVRTLWERGPGEYRVFTIDRVFRPDTPDPTHLMEFHQLDGIIVGPRVSLKDLLEFFREFSRGLGLGEVRFRPAYFPFTEPSVEGYIKHPKLGWIEALPGGMFRRQVLEPLGLRGYNVAAWGIGIDRVVMILMEINDIRDLYTDDVREIERAPIPRVMLGAGHHS